MNSQSNQPTVLTDTEIKNGIVDGIESANRMFERWSGGWWVSDYGVESMVAVHVAGALFDVAEGRRGLVTMENPCHELVDLAGRNNDAQWPLGDALIKSQRVDVAVWRPADEVEQERLRAGVWFHVPVGVVELKRQWLYGPCREDLVRVSTIVSRLGPSGNGTIEWGAVGFFIHNNPDEGRTIENAQQGVRNMLTEPDFETAGCRYDVSFGRTYGYDHKKYRRPSWGEYQCSAACILVTPKG